MKRKYFWPLLLAGSMALMTLALAGEGEKADPTAPETTAPGPFVYVLEADGQMLGEYAGCAGLGSSNEIEDQTTVTTGGLLVAKALCGALRWAPIRLKCAAPGNALVWEWRNAVERAGASAGLRTGHITMYAAGSTEPLAVWTFERGWPARLVCDGARLELVIIHEGLSLGATEARPAARTR